MSSASSCTRAGGGVQDEDQKVLQYPPGSEAMDPVTLTRGDINRLDPYEFLNDNVVDFYLQFLSCEHPWWLPVVLSQAQNPRKISLGNEPRETRKGTFGGSAMSYADMRIPHGPLLAAFDYGAPACVCFAFCGPLFAICYYVANSRLFAIWYLGLRSCAFLRVPVHTPPT